MTAKNFIRILNKRGFSYKIKGDKIIITHKGDIMFRLTSLPPNVHFNNSGDVDLTSLTSLPPNVHFNNPGRIDLPSLIEMSSGIVFNTSGMIVLRSLTELPSDVSFDNATGTIFLDSLTKLPPEVLFDNADYISLDSIKELPYGYKFNNVNGSVSLNSLTELRHDIEFNNTNGILYLNSIKELSHPRKFINDIIIMRSLERIHPGVEFNVSEFNNESQIKAGSVSGNNDRCRQIGIASSSWWEGKIPGIVTVRLFNLMIKKGMFI